MKRRRTTFFIQIIEGNELEETASDMAALVKGIDIQKLSTTSIILGRIPYRRIDPQYTGQYLYLVSDYNIKSESPRVYDEETFYKLRKFKKRVYTEEYD